MTASDGMGSPEPHASDRQFEAEVFPAELDEIARRRTAAGLEPIDTEATARPSSRHGLLGLALSGGGIRSATFSLGVVQTLARRGLLKRVDYLSTVSGGGYLGSCLSSLLNDPGVSTDVGFPLANPPGASEPPALTHLRNGSNYLAPGGILDKLRLPALLLRGIVLNLLAFIPLVMVAVLATELAYERGPDWDYLNRSIPILIAIFLTLVVLYPFVVRFPRVGPKIRQSYELILAAFFILPVVALLLVPLKTVTEVAIETGWNTTSQVIREHLSPLSFSHHLTWAIILGVVLGLAFVGSAFRSVGRLSAKLVIVVLGVLGPAILLALYWVLCVLQIDSPYLHLEVRDELNVRAALEERGVRFVQSPSVVKVTGSDSSDGADQWLIIGRLADAGDEVDTLVVQVVREACRPSNVGAPDPAPQEGQASGALAPLVPARPDSLRVEEAPGSPFCIAGFLREDLDGYAAARGRKALSTLLREREIVLGDSLSRERDIVIASRPLPPSLPDSLSGARGDVYWTIEGPLTVGGHPHPSLAVTLGGRLHIRNAHLDMWDGRRDWIFFGILAGLLLLNGVFFDVNLTSWHTFYRDALSRVYLIRTEEETGGVVSNDDQKLAALNTHGSVAPYHLLNVVLNLEGSTDRSLRGRKGDFFFFAKRFTGGERTGYCETERLEDLDRHLDLGTAMAISAAAAAPNMGRVTIRPLIFLMTLLNVRLGYWLLHPRVAREASGLPRFFRRWLGPGPRYLWKEALGRPDEKGTYVNLSDGGHIENLGIYQLLKRRCGVILAVDGEADAGMAFGGLVTLIRFARIDMGIKIDLDLKEIRKSDEGLSRNHWSIGTIDYGGGETGTLVYVKSSVTGDENEYVRSYRSHVALFPHESTADQFFSENQFEAYRALGAHAAERMLEDPKLPEPLRAS